MSRSVVTELAHVDTDGDASMADISTFNTTLDLTPDPTVVFNVPSRDELIRMLVPKTGAGRPFSDFSDLYGTRPMGPEKRSRGRPRKVQSKYRCRLPETPVDDQDAVISEGYNVSSRSAREPKRPSPVVIEDGVEQPRRKRGRPRKKREGSASAELQSDTTVKLERKRSVSVKLEAESQSSSDSEDEDSEIDIDAHELFEWKPGSRGLSVAEELRRKKKAQARLAKANASLSKGARKARKEALTKEKVEEKVQKKLLKQLKKEEKKKPDVINQIIELDEAGENSDARSQFIFIRTKDHRILKPRKKTLEEHREKIISMDPFASPKKQRVGVLQLEEVDKSPSKRGIMPFSLLSPSKTPNGRAGSPRKLKKELQERQDRSARKKLNQKLYAVLDDGFENFDNEIIEDDVRVAEQIIRESKLEANGKEDQEIASPLKSLAETPNKRSDIPTHNPDFVPTPLPTIRDDEDFLDARYDDKALFLDGPDGYFDQHRHKVRTSHNSMVQAPALDYDEFNSLVLLSGFIHNKQRSELLAGYREMYTQWLFELSQGFNLLFFGIGSKRSFLQSFVQDCLLDHVDVPTLVINGYNPIIGFPEILKQIVSIFKLTSVPKRAGEAVDFIVSHFAKMSNKSTKLIILFHNIDAEPLRDEKIQDYMSKIASIKQFNVIASVDHVNAPLLWDSIRLANFNFVWHNLTTFTDYLTETSFRDPLVLGQTQKSAGSKGAKYVLSSLTSNSKALYRVLASNQLQIMEEEIASKKDEPRETLRGKITHGLEFNRFFHLCAEEFISSNEINFRTMLMEFVEHKMAGLQKDHTGTEMVFIPFSLEEIQKLLEEELL